jgi:hypothetical protein
MGITPDTEALLKAIAQKDASLLDQLEALEKVFPDTPEALPFDKPRVDYLALFRELDHRTEGVRLVESQKRPPPPKKRKRPD